MTEYQKLPAPRFDPPHKGPHPVLLVAATSVAAVALIAAAQMLRPLNASSASRDTSVPAPVSTKVPLRGVAPACPNCGVVVAVRETTVAGAVGGAIAGHQIGKQARSTNTYHVDVRLNNGMTRTFAYADPPALATGARIEVRGDQLVARG